MQQLSSDTHDGFTESENKSSSFLSLSESCSSFLLTDASDTSVIKAKVRKTSPSDNNFSTPEEFNRPLSLFSTPKTCAGITNSSSSSSTPSSSRMRTPATSSSKFKTPSSSSRSKTPSSSSRFKTPSSSSRSKTPSSSSRSKTPSSSSRQLTSSATISEIGSVVVALVEGRGLARGEVGIAGIDWRRPVLKLSQFSDGQTYVKTMTKIQILQPSEIIVPSTAGESGSLAKLFSLLSDRFGNINLVRVQRKYFSETKGLQYVKQLCASDFNSVEMEVRNKFYCLSAAAALIKYLEFTQNMYYVPGSMKVLYRGGEETTMIDMTTSINLELMQNIRNANSEHSLFGVLNSTKTPMGCRLLRSNILQPPNCIETINMRLDAVQELTEKFEMFYTLQAIFSKVIDIESILTFMIEVKKQETLKVAEQKITNMIYLKHILELVEPLKNAIANASSPLIETYSNVLSDMRFQIILEKINKVLNEDTKFQKGAFNMSTQKCFAVQQNINGMLDVSRKVYSELIDEVADIIQGLAEKHKLSLKSSYNSSRGFHIQLNCGGNNSKFSIDNLPEEFINISKSKSTLNFTAVPLLKLNERLKLVLQEVYLMTNQVVNELLIEIREHMGCLYGLSECIAMLDMLVGFAHNCTVGQFTKPEFTDTLAIKQGLHPILQKICFEPPVPNDVYSSAESNISIITGPNMSGKSTFLRQIVLLQIMAQIGSFVPAEFASFSTVDQIFSRIGSDDDIETNSSTFVLEMKETNYILQNATMKSMIVIDELGRGTNLEEGLGICYAICENLVNRKAKVFIATHFLEITNLGQHYPNVQNYHFEVQQFEHQMTTDKRCFKSVFTHILSQGVMKGWNYGIYLAEMSTLPVEIIDASKVLCSKLSQLIPRQASEEREIQIKRENFKLAKRIAQVAANSKLDDLSLCEFLKKLKEHYQQEIAGIEHESEDKL